VDERGVFELRCYQVQDVDSRFGVSHLHLFADAKGRRAKWFSSRAILEPGVYEIAAKVKKHEEYKGRKTTVLTYCEVVRRIEVSS